MILSLGWPQMGSSAPNGASAHISLTIPPQGSITLGPGHEGNELKVSRAYIAGLGTTGVLIGSFLLLLTVGSALVAFQGVPGQATNGDLSSIELQQQAERAGGAVDG